MALQSGKNSKLARKYLARELAALSALQHTKQKSDNAHAMQAVTCSDGTGASRFSKCSAHACME